MKCWLQVIKQRGLSILLTKVAATVSLGITMIALFSSQPVLSAEVSPALSKVIEAAEKEGVLELSWGRGTFGGERGAKRAQEEINKMFGTNLQITFTPGGSMPSIGFKMLTEQKAGQKALTDVYIGAVGQIATFSRRKLFTPVNFKALVPFRVTDKMVEADSAAVRVATSASGIVYNTNLAPYKPKYLSDFLKPEWKGKLASTPYLANFELLASKEVLGRKGALDYVRKLSGQISGFIRCPDTERLLSGEFVALIFDCGGKEAFVAKEKGAPLDQAVPLDFGKISYYYLAVPTHAPHQNAAKLYIAYILTQQGQNMVWDLFKSDLHTLPDSRMKSRIAKYEQEGVKFNEYTIGWWNDHPEVTAVGKEMRKILRKKKK